ncbi:hypothetical protein UPYG_G00265350 [Umbra pygmaea]|uniref:Uncharacterized protein n=1 Tax=Umbra pygmaea TaxID=75934 RepID=A0ABD0X044_UMBPY
MYLDHLDVRRRRMRLVQGGRISGVRGRFRFALLCPCLHPSATRQSEHRKGLRSRLEEGFAKMGTRIWHDRTRTTKESLV